MTRSPSLSAEVLGAVILALPFALVQLLNQQAILPGNSGDEFPSSSETLSATIQTSSLAGFVVLALASVYRQRDALDSGASAKSSIHEKVDTACVQEASKLAISVILPLLAASCLGGAYVGISFLVLSASGLVPLPIDKINLARLVGWKRLLLGKILTTTTFVFSLCVILASNSSWTTAVGGMALLLSLFIIQPPFLKPSTPSRATFSPPPSSKTTSAVDGDPSKRSPVSGMSLAVSSLISTQNPKSPVVATAISGAAAILSQLIFSQTLLNPGHLLQAGVVGTTACLAFLVAQPHRQRSQHKIGLLSGSILAVASSVPLQSYKSTISLGVLAAVFCGTVYADDRGALSTGAGQVAHVHHHHHHHHQSHSKHDHKSKFTVFLLKALEDYPFFYTTLADPETRGLFYFMLLNLSFMVVQGTYAYITDSLGLLGDSVHMFFDCLAVGIGLWASVMSKRPQSQRFPYGYSKIEDLSGFGNGVLLM